MQRFISRLLGKKPPTTPEQGAPELPPTGKLVDRAPAMPEPPAPSLSPTRKLEDRTPMADLSAQPTQPVSPPVVVEPVIAEPPPIVVSMTPTIKRPQPTSAEIAALVEEAAAAPPVVTPAMSDEQLAERKAADRKTYGEDLWGIAQKQRDAAIDIAKLQRFGLPVLQSEMDLADWLGITLGQLRWYTHDKAADTTWHYVRFTIPKRSGGQRVILAPKRDLKALQRRVLEDIVGKMPVAPNVHGFVPKHSILTNAEPHVGRQVLLNLDLKDFFPSVTFPRVRGLLISMGYSFAVASALALLCTEYEREPFERDGQTYFVSIGPRHLVQGAPTSPALANLVAWRLDKRLAGLAAKRGYTYTRYADDLTFSGDDREAVNTLRFVAQKIIREEQFQPNAKKTRVAGRATRQIVTGLVVNDTVATPRSTRRKMRAILHNAQQTGLMAQNRDNRPHFPSYIDGMISFINGVSPTHAAKLSQALRQVKGDTSS